MGIQLSGPWRYRLRSLAILLWSIIFILLRRLFRGPRLPGWSLTFEGSSHYQKALYQAVYAYADIHDGRKLLDALVVRVPAFEKITIETVSDPVNGTWFRPGSTPGKQVILYCHGAYAFYARAEQSLIAELAVITGFPVFAIDYRLTPENPFPAQLEDGLDAYAWLLGQGYQAQDIILFGTSAGGNMALSLALELRNDHRPLPRLVITLSPWTDIGNSGTSIYENEPFDILDEKMIQQGASMFTAGHSPLDPRVSPLHADLNGLPRLYLQAGEKEIFIDMIRAFERKARSQGVVVQLETWGSMTHVFQAYGDRLPEASAAMKRLAAVIQNS